MKPTQPIRLTAHAALTLVAAIFAMASVARADVIYDTLGITFNNSTAAHIGGQFDLGELQDNQRADDFDIAAGPGFHITSVTGDFLTGSALGFQAPAGGMLVEFFSSDGDSPNAAASFSIFTSNYTYTPMDFDGTAGGRFNIDLSGEGIDLGEGTWWLSIQPVDETANGIEYRWLRQTGSTIGNQPRRRNGGLAHGNGYPGDSNSFDWSTSVGSNGTLAMAIEGNAIPGPGALSLIGLAGLFGCSRNRHRRA